MREKIFFGEFFWDSDDFTFDVTTEKKTDSDRRLKNLGCENFFRKIPQKISPRCQDFRKKQPKIPNEIEIPLIPIFSRVKSEVYEQYEEDEVE